MPHPPSVVQVIVYRVCLQSGGKDGTYEMESCRTVMEKEGQDSLGNKGACETDRQAKIEEVWRESQS